MPIHTVLLILLIVFLAGYHAGIHGAKCILLDDAKKAEDAQYKNLKDQQQC